MELSPSSGGAAEALSWPEMFSGLESDSPLPPEDLDAVVPVSGAVAGGMLDRILLESVCQQQSWVRVFGKDHKSSASEAVVSCLSFSHSVLWLQMHAAPQVFMWVLQIQCMLSCLHGRQAGTLLTEPLN